MSLYVGTSGFSFKEWKGPFYPEHLADSEMLSYYGKQFLSVEINNTFHRMPKPELLEHWAAQVPAEFRFVLKAPQSITHMHRLKNAEDSVAYLLKVAGSLKMRLGPILFQLPPDLKKDLPRLETFLKLIPPPQRAAFEFRHQTWFDEETFALLRSCNAALCIAEAESDLDIPFVSTANWGYLRLRLPDYDKPTLSKKAKLVLEQGWADAFVFFKHEDEGKGPKLARQFIEAASKPTRRRKE